jgi:hypothetical protein
MKCSIDFLMWIVFAVIIILTYPFLFNKRDDDDR